MFYIYADGNAVYAPHLSTEGYGVLSPKLTLELNKAGSLDFVLPPGNLMYDGITKLKSIITVFQNGDELFRGRVLHDEKDFYKQKQTYCEGELAFLLDSQQRPIKEATTKTVKAWFQYYISNHNSRVEAAKKFTAGNITVADANTSLTVKTEDYSSTWDEIEQRLLNVYGGYLKVRVVNGVRYLDWLAESGATSSQIIEFGRNLLDITEHITAENIFTVLIPLGKTQSSSSGATTGKLTIASVNNNKDYLEDATAINLFGRIEATMDWSEVDNASTLKSLGQTALKQNIEQSITLTVKAVDLHLLDVNIEAIRLGDWVQVISLPHGLNKLFQCTKIVYDMVSPDQTEYTFGVAYSSLTDKQANAQKLTQNAVTVIQNVNALANYGATTANKAAADIQTIINSGVTGEGFYPIGSIYTAINSTNPAEIFGFGTWELVRKSVVDTGWQDFSSVNENYIGTTQSAYTRNQWRVIDNILYVQVGAGALANIDSAAEDEIAQIPITGAWTSNSNTRVWTGAVGGSGAVYGLALHQTATYIRVQIKSHTSANNHVAPWFSAHFAVPLEENFVFVTGEYEYKYVWKRTA